MRKNRTKRRTRRRRRMRGGFMGLNFSNFSMPALPSWLGGSDDKKKDPMAAAAAPVAAAALKNLRLEDIFFKDFLFSLTIFSPLLFEVN